MAQRKREATSDSRPQEVRLVRGTLKRFTGHMLVFLLGASVTVAAAWLLGVRPFANRLEESRPPSLRDLASRPPEGLAGCDIAEMNLLCAEGLPGAENLNVRECLATLDRWAAHVKSETDRYLHKFYEAPAEYNGSEGYFRILTLITVLQQDFKVRYNKERIRDIDFKNSRDLFIHGMIGSDNGGTCVSMPVLYVAVARRLGYPVYLVLAKGHVFARWESVDGKERFNIEGTNQGLNCFEDDYYKTWPLKMSEAEVKAGHFLKSLTPAEELTVFLAARGHCLEDIGRLPEAQVVYAQAHRLSPGSPEYLGFLAEAVWKEIPRGAETRAAGRGSRTTPDPIEELRRIEAINAYNRWLTGRGGAGGPAVPPSPYGPRPRAPGPVSRQP